jgi:transcription antitermination factor NusG
MLLEHYIAIADYTKEAKKEVNLKVGQMVEVIDKNEMGRSCSNNLLTI